MTALMENSNAHRPAPATDEILNKLEREVLEEGGTWPVCLVLTLFNSFPAPLLEKDCAVCKDQFALRTEDPDEQVVITLPCKHPFHSPCILPWLKQNGTCPTCRHQLVPQPGSTSNPNENAGAESGPSTSASNPPQHTGPTNPSAQPRTNTSSRWSAHSRDRDRGLRESPERNDAGGGGFFGMFGSLLHPFSGGHQNPGPAPSSFTSGPDSLPGSWEPSPGSRPESRDRSSHTRNQSTQSNNTYPNSGSTRSQSSYERLGFGLGSSRNTGSNNRDRSGSSPGDSAARNFGRHRQGSHDRDRERDRNRDRNGQSQRRNTNRWEHPELD